MSNKKVTRVPFTRQELAFRYYDNDFKEQQKEDQRVRTMFETLLPIARSNGFMTQNEKKNFYYWLKFSTMNDGHWSEFECCKEYYFADVYLTYAHDFTGGGQYHKVYGKEVGLVPLDERVSDITYLETEADAWEKVVIASTNSSDITLARIAVEATNEIKIIDSLPEFAPYLYTKGSRLYKYKKRSALLFSKYAYLMAKEVLDYPDYKSIIFFCGLGIEFDADSFAHIMSRHFSLITRPYKVDKSFHSEDFLPRSLDLQLREILSKIEASGHFNVQAINTKNFSVSIAYKGIPHKIWIKEKNRSESGRGNVKYLAISSFYPVEEKEELKKLAANYSLLRIDENLSFYKLS